jgi:hypothetical protein
MSNTEEFSTDKNRLSENERSFLELAMSLDHGTPLFKIRHFVGDSQITAYAKFKQIMLELRSREEIIEQVLVTIETNRAQIELARENLESADSPAKTKLAQLELTSTINDLMKTERRLEMAYSERDKFLTVLKEMYETGEAILPDGTDLRDAVQDEYMSEFLEAEHWKYRLGKQAALDIIAYGNIGTGNLEAISMMSEKQAAETLSLALSWSHGVKSALGSIEEKVLEGIRSGSILPTMKIERQSSPIPDQLEK